MSPRRAYLVTGGAGFIGSHAVERLLAEEKNALVTVYDNFSSGSMRHLQPTGFPRRLRVVKGDIADSKVLCAAMRGVDTVYHFASNPDIARAAVDPDIDFRQGTALTRSVLEAMRVNRARFILYASGSGVYGDAGRRLIGEDYSPLLPISTYGAGKLAGEAMMCAYCHMFGMKAAVFRFANVVGSRQTHGVAFDFIRKLDRDPSRLHIFGNGKQDKAYIYVDDVIEAMRLVQRRQTAVYERYNVSVEQTMKVAQIAGMVTKAMGLRNVEYIYSGGDRGWKGDVPVVRLDSRKIRSLGWKNRYTCRGAMALAIEQLCADPAVRQRRVRR